MKTPNKEHGVVIRAYTHNELARMYGVSWKTMQRWLKPHEKEIGPKNGHFYTSIQVKIIIRLIGPPEERA